MKIFQNIFSRGDSTLKKKAAEPDLTVLDDFSYVDKKSFDKDGYSYNAWVNIAVGILIRNIARASFILVRGGEELRSGPLYELFRRPNPDLSRFD
jgi:hypothetical protein